MDAVRSSTSVANAVKGACGVGAACCLEAWLSIHFGFSPLQTALTNAMLLAGLLLAPVGRWWLFVLAVLPSYLYLAAYFEAGGVPRAAMFCQFVAGLFQAVLAALLVRRLVGLRQRLDSLRPVAEFILLAVIAAPAISSVFAADVLMAIGWMDDFWATSRAWFLSNALMTLILTPLIVLSASEPERWRRIPLRRYVEGGVLMAGTFAVGIVVFGIKDPNRQSYALLLYAPLPLFVWAAVRFELRTLSACLLIIAPLSLAHAFAGRGPFATGASGENVAQFQLYFLAISLPLTLLATVLQERRRAVAALERSEREARGQLAQLCAIYRARHLPRRAHWAGLY
jgi:integral membrane sensor domain MASE1